MRVIEQLAEHAARRPEALAVRAFGPCAEAPLTYAALWERVGGLAAFVSSRVPEGGVVLLSCANRPEFFIAYLGVLAAGRTVFPVHPKLTAAELRSAAAVAGVRAVIGEGAALEAIDDPATPRISVRSLHTLSASAVTGRGEPGLMLQSSGTTGLPKVVYRDGASLDAVAENVARAAALTPEDRVLGAVPIGHSYGMENALLGPIWAGSCALLCDGFDVPVVTSLLQGERGATVLPGGAFMFEMLARLEGAGVGAGLRLAYSAGSPLPTGVAGAFADRFGMRVGQLYGATEVGSVTFNDPGERGRALPGFEPGAVGVGMRGVRTVIVDAETGRAEVARSAEGQVLIHAPSMLSRYLGDSASPLVMREGAAFFPTGDLGRLDGQGRLWITGRLKLLIDIGGVKVNPLEVEQVLAEHPSVGRCVVVAEAVSGTVSRVRAIVTPRTAGDSVDTDAVRAFVRERLASHKVPRVIEVRGSLPLSPGGKVQRWRLGTEGGAA